MASIFKEGSPYWVDRICSFGPKLHNLQRINDSITSRILELQLSFWLWGILRPLWRSKKFLSMVAHQAHRLLKWFLLNVENYKQKCEFFDKKIKKQITYKMCPIQISCYGWVILRYNIPKLKGKIRGPHMESYFVMQKFLPYRFLKITKQNFQFLGILRKKATHISWSSHHDSIL